MRTLVISDLHLGRAGRTDLLRRADLREPLLEALADVDRLVILGDGLELREAAHRDAVDVAGAFFAAVGEVLGPDKPLILLAGNHDHGIAAGWIDARLQTEPSGFLGLEQRFAPADAGPLARRLAEAALPGPGRARLPGHLAARRRLRLPRPLRRRARHGPDLRAPRGRRDGALRGAAPARARRHAGRLRGGPEPAVRLAARADPARRPHASSAPARAPRPAPTRS